MESRLPGFGAYLSLLGHPKVSGMDPISEQIIIVGGAGD
jgi:hypothetical protein